MPGIVGIVGSRSVKDDTSKLRQMLSCMLHEPTYTSGTYVNERLDLCAGWVNRRGSFSDCMPVWNEARDICLIYYGENFPQQGTDARLKANGHSFVASNAGSLVHLFEEGEDQFFSRLNGWFSGLLIDLRKGKIVLFNDRYGMQRIYWHQGKDAFYFSSEAKSLLKVCPELRELDIKSLGEVFGFGCVVGNRTLFTGVSLLPPGSIWTFRKGGLKKENYFRPEEWESQPPLEKEPFYQALRETFTTVLPKYTEAGENRVAVSLTGGLDTRMIMSGMEMHDCRLPCYTFGGMYRDCFDVKIARKVAKICGQTHQVLEVGEKFLSQFPSLAEKTVYITDGNLDVTGSPDLYANMLAKEVAPVRLTGNYGSEILRGSRHLKASPPRAGLFTDVLEKSIVDAAETLKEYDHDHRVTFAAFRQAPWLHHNRLSLEQSQITLRSPFLDNDLVKLMYRAPAEAIDSNELSLRLINDGNRQLGNIMTDRGLGGNKGYPISKLAHLYREFLFKADYAVNYGMPQWYAKLDYYLPAPLHLERYFLGRHKFYHFRVWFRDELSAYVREILLDPRSLKRPYLNGRFAEKMVLDHTSGRANYTNEVTDLLTIELLQRVMIDG